MPPVAVSSQRMQLVRVGSELKSDSTAPPMAAEFSVIVQLVKIARELKL